MIPKCSIKSIILYHTYNMYTATPITIGVQHTTYSVGEIDDTQAVCIKVISGDTAGREIIPPLIEMQYVKVFMIASYVL